MTVDQMLALSVGSRVTDARQDGRVRLPCTISNWTAYNDVRIGLVVTPDDPEWPPTYVLHGSSRVTMQAIAERLTHIPAVQAKQPGKGKR